MQPETPVPIDSAVSSARSEAARRNGSKSRGPKTELGKRIASLNALKHGMYSPKIVLPDESQEDFDHLRDDYFVEFKPQGPAERHEVETMVVAEWRIRRFRNAETTTVIGDMERAAEAVFPDKTPYIAKARFWDNSEVQAVYKFESACQRDYDRALRRLLDLQKHRNEPKRAQPKVAHTEPRASAGGLPEPVAASAPLQECAISHCTAPCNSVVEFHPIPPSHHRDGESSPTSPDTTPLNSSKHTPLPWPEGCTTENGILINDQAKSNDRWK